MFKAKGRLLSIKGNKITAIMHEGFLGTEHQVKLVIDEGFRNHVLKQLDAKLTPEQKDGQIYKDQRYIGEKKIHEHEIEITIK